MDIRQRIQSVIDKTEGMSVRKASLDAGLSDSMLGKFLNGSVDSLTLKTVDKLAEALGVDPRWLAYGEGDPDAATDIGDLWAKIGDRDKARAKAILAAFAKTGTDG